MNQASGEPSLLCRMGTWLRTKYSHGPNNATDPTLTNPPSYENGTSDGIQSTSKDEKLHENGTHIVTNVCDSSSPVHSPQAPPPNASEGGGESSPIRNNEKVPIPTRIWRSLKVIIFSSYINILLVFVPVGIALGALHRTQGDSSPISPTVIFAVNAVAIIPLAYLLGFATESVARKMGDKIGALLNVTFGNAVELIIL